MLLSSFRYLNIRDNGDTAMELDDDYLDRMIFWRENMARISEWDSPPPPDEDSSSTIAFNAILLFLTSILLIVV